MIFRLYMYILLNKKRKKIFKNICSLCIKTHIAILIPCDHDGVSCCVGLTPVSSININFITLFGFFVVEGV